MMSYQSHQPKMAQVVAPATLDAGYTFEVTCEGKTFNVTVPEGGVEEGQAFMVPMPEEQAPTVTSGSLPGNSATTTSKQSDFAVPTGKFRDGLCDCFNYGLCHPFLCMAFWLKPIALAQVMTRMQLNAGARQTSKEGASSTVMIIAIVMIASWLLIVIFGATVRGLLVVVIIGYSLYILAIGTMTRYAMRQKFSIPEEHCDGCGALEDCCCMYWCGCCSVIQMGRHTHDDKVYQGHCCTKTGLSKDAPDIV